MSDDLTPQGDAAVRLALLVPGLRAELAEARASARVAWDVHAEHVEHTNRRSLHDFSLIEEARRELAEAQAVIERVRALADDLREYNPGHGDYCRAGLLIHEALDPEAAS